MAKPTRASWSMPDSSWPIDCSSSSASSSGSSISSASVLASRKIASAGATSARSSSVNSAFAISSGSTLNTYRNGLAVISCSSRSGGAVERRSRTPSGRSAAARARLLSAATSAALVLGSRASFCSRGKRVLDGLQVGEDQLGVDRLDVVGRVDLAVDVDDVRVAERADDLADRVGLADVGEELVAQPLARARAADDAGDVDERHGGRNDLRRVVDLRQHGQPRVGHADHADVGLDGRERVVGREDVVLRQRVEQGRLADVGQADDADSESHGPPVYGRAGRAYCRRSTQ